MDDRTNELLRDQRVAIRIFFSIPARNRAISQANLLGGTGGRRPMGDVSVPSCLGLPKPRPAAREASVRFRPIRMGFSPRPPKREVVVTNGARDLIERAARLESSGAAARSSGDESAAEAHFREALGLTVEAADRAAHYSGHQALLEALRMAVRLALSCGEVSEGRRLMHDAVEADPVIAHSDDWTQLRDVAAWPDAWLVAAVRRDPPDAAALDALADRHWKALFGRCYLLTVNHDKASDLAQQAWCRVLRVRQGLKPGGNFPAYLVTTAANLWRDSHRWSRRAGPIAEEKLASLNESIPTQEGESISLADLLPDLNSLQAEEQIALKLDIDRALERLTPRLREVLVARFITGESCAEIGLRHGRTEQTISGWVREAIRAMKPYLEEPAPGAVPANEP
jgi:RNA polymerase sigma factor (sigma-70 family)